MKSSNGTQVVTQLYCEEDAEEIVRLIRRNFREVNVKDYGVKAMTALSAKVGFRVRDDLVYRNKNMHQLKRVDLI